LPFCQAWKWLCDDDGVEETSQETSHRMSLLASCDPGPDASGGEGLGLLERGGRRWLYMAHESGPGSFTVVEVTAPRRPRVAHREPLARPDVRSNSLAVWGTTMLVARQLDLSLLRGGLTRGTEPGSVGMEVWSLDDPERPRMVAFFDTSGPGSAGCHCLWFVDGRRAFLSTGMPDFQPAHPLDHQLAVIVDVEDPVRPREVGRWWLPGTSRADEAALERHPPRHDRGFRAHNVNVYPARPDRAYVGYIDGGAIILDISDESRPRMVSRLDHHPPLAGFTHTVLPLLDRSLLAITDEAVENDNGDWPKRLWLADVSDERRPLLLGSAPMPPVDAFGGVRYGAHNLHELDPVPLSWQSSDMVVGAFFAGGVRAYDVREPWQPEELGWLRPTPTAQVNDVWVDDRRIIYAVDRPTGTIWTIQPEF
jgi:hypothetical protein